jgi:DNA-binding CsgD family transcriptional regulator
MKTLLNKDELYQKYIVENLSQKQVAKYFNCSTWIVQRNLKEYHIESHKLGTWNQSNIVKLTQYQTEILNGAMLGDGSLIISKNGRNPQFTYNSKSKQHVKYVTQEFMQYSYKEGIKYYEKYDNRTKKTYNSYSFRSISDKGFLEIYNKWYKNGVKHLPKDLILTPTICLIWYIGDGGIINNQKHNGQYIKLSTHCFSKKEQEKILIPQLKQFNAKLYKVGISKNNIAQYAIYIPKKSMQNFLNYIGKCPFKDYKYKWIIKPNKIDSYIDVHEQWKKLYLSGIGYTKIAKQYNCDPTTVLYYLKKINVYKYFEGYKKFYKDWENKYLDGFSCKEISEEYSCHIETVRHHLKQVGIYKK